MQMSRQAVGALCVGVLYWYVVNLAFDTKEPWDAQAYWVFAYPVALAISAGLGFLFGRRPWLTGGLVIFAQLPVMLAHAGTGPLFAAGLLILCLLAIPAILVAWVAGWLRKRTDAA